MTLIAFVAIIITVHYMRWKKALGTKGAWVPFLPSQADLNYVHTFLCLKETGTHYLASCYISNALVVRSSLLTVTTCVGSSCSHLLIRHCKRGSPSQASCKQLCSWDPEVSFHLFVLHMCQLPSLPAYIPLIPWLPFQMSGRSLGF